MKTLSALLATGLAAAALLAPALSASAGQDTPPPNPSQTPPPAQTATGEKDVVDTAVAAGNFTTLVKLVTDAGLADTLKGAGPFTILAPTDAAFKKLPRALLDRLAGDKELLKKVLTYHVLPGKILSTDLKTMAAKTVEGETIRVRVDGKTVRFNNAKPVAVDVQASNGVIHAIDAVLLPPSVARTLRGGMGGGRGGRPLARPGGAPGTSGAGGR